MNNIVISNKINNIIFSDYPNSKSRASYLLLIESLRKTSEYSDELQKYYDFRAEFLNGILAKYGYLECVYCHRKDLIVGYITIKESYKNNRIPNLCTIDHVIPLSKSGAKYNIENCVCSCKKCNRAKGDKSLDEYLKNKK